MTGDPDAFAHLAPGQVGALRELLRRDEESFTFEVERLGRLGELIGIANLTTSYEYLKEGEHDGVKGGGISRKSRPTCWRRRRRTAGRAASGLTPRRSG